MQCTGTVVYVNGPVMLVRVDPAERCDGCTRVSGCGVAMLSGLFQRHLPEVSVPRLPGSASGHSVRIEISDAAAMPLAFIGFLLPVILMLAASIVAQLVLTQTVNIAVATSALVTSLAGIGGFIGGLIAYKPLSGYVCSAVGSPVIATGLLPAD